ncbi:MAG: CocE/NonD family hydrolase [Acidimicrobiales bacterium]
MRRPPAHRRHLHAVAAAVAAVVLLAACASDAGSGEGSKATETTETAGATGSTAAPASAGHACDQGAVSDDLQVEPVDGTPTDRTLTSDDGTEIRLHWMPVDGATADDPAPTILMGPGWSLPGDTSTEGAALFAALSIGGIWDHGYNVLTWDPRGFGQSGGVATVNDPDKEGRDVQLMLDFVAAQPEAQTDGDGDPRVGMVGFSYGGGIQLTVAGIDCRVDAIVPGIAWHSLETSLFKAETVKTGWANILTSTVPEDRLDPHITSASASGIATGTLSDEDREWFLSRGPGDELVGQIDVPTLLVGGTVDNLFTLDEDITNHDLLQSKGVPVAMIWFCGGHGTCLTNAGDPDRVAEASFAWLDRYVKGDSSAPEVPLLDLVDQDGVRWTAAGWPLEGGTSISVEGSGSLDLNDDSRSGGGEVTAVEGDPLAGITSDITPTEADVAIEATSAEQDDDALLLGAPQLTLTYRGTLPEGETDGRVFAQLVDDDTGIVLGNQITPIQVTLDGEEHTTEVPLEVIAHHLKAGHTVTLQLVATSTAYGSPHLGGSLDVTALTLELPVAPPTAVTKH